MPSEKQIEAAMDATHGNIPVALLVRALTAAEQAEPTTDVEPVAHIKRDENKVGVIPNEEMYRLPDGAPLYTRPSHSDARLREATDVEPVAWRIHAPKDDYYGVGPDTLQFHPLEQCDLEKGYSQTPLYTHPTPSEARLREALEGLLNHYVELVLSGDAGFWDPEKEDEVIAARAALKEASDD